MKWATRSGCHIDRAATGWLIQRFLDPAAEFIFVNDPEDVPADAVAFDIPGVPLSHRGADCTFETVLREHFLHDPILWELARVVHQADLEDDLFEEPESAGLDAVLRGLALVREDSDILELSRTIFDGLYELRRRRLLGA